MLSWVGFSSIVVVFEILGGKGSVLGAGGNVIFCGLWRFFRRGPPGLISTGMLQGCLAGALLNRKNFLIEFLKVVVGSRSRARARDDVYKNIG